MRWYNTKSYNIISLLYIQDYTDYEVYIKLRAITNKFTKYSGLYGLWVSVYNTKSYN